MPIAAPGKSALESAIRQAFVKAKNAGEQTSASPDDIISQLAADIASAVDTYTTTCVVTINPGQAVVGNAAGFYPVVANVITPGTS